MNIEFDNLSFEQTLVSELTPDFEMRRRSKRRGMKQTRLARVSRKSPKGKIVYGKSGKRLKGVYVKKTTGRRF